MTGSEVSGQRLAALYATPAPSWFRVNFVTTVDGAATGADGLSGSINNAADKEVFDLLRAQADVIVVGAGTAAVEGYRPTDKPIVVVTNRGRLPESLAGAEPGRVLVATHGSALGLGALRSAIGAEQVMVVGDHAVDLVELRRGLAQRGWTQVLSEGGPSLFAGLLAQQVVDEICLTTVPQLVVGEHTRIVHGMPAALNMRLHVLLEKDGSLLGRWLVRSAEG